MAPAPSTDRLLSAREVANRLGISQRSLWRRIAESRIPLPVTFPNGKRYYWRESDISAFIAALPNIPN